MLDFLLGAFFVVLFLRGWLRGFVREAMDLLGVVLGIALAFRLSSPAGAIVEGLTGASPLTSMLAGGVLVFVLVGLGAAVLAHYLQKAARLPGLALGNRLTGAGLALGWGLFLATLSLSMLSLFSLPAALAGHIEESSVAHALTRPGGVPQRLFTGVAGDRVLEVLLNLEQVVGGRQVVLQQGEVIALPAVDPDEVSPDLEAARELFARLNAARVEAGVAPLEWSARLAGVAAGHSFEMYVEGYFAHESPATGTVAGRLAAAGIPFAVSGENLALAADPDEAHRGLMDSHGHRANKLAAGYTEAGIAVYSGPLGLMVVEVYTG